MTGLDNIINEILAEARRDAEGILTQARAGAGEIKAQAQAQAAVEVKEIEDETDKHILALNEGYKASFELRRRQVMLEARQTALNETLSAALLELNGLPDKAYFEFIIKLAAAQAETGEGELLLNARDKARMPANFQHSLNSSLPAGRSLTISDAAARIDGGFIIRYGDVEENCSFTAIFRQRRDEFTDLIRDLLFTG